MATGAKSGAKEDAPDPGRLAADLEAYLAEHLEAAVLEDGSVLFDMRRARYSVTESHGRCLLQLWSEERNLVRTVVGLEARANCLRLSARRMGAPRPTALEIVPSNDRRTPTARDSARRTYPRVLERVLARQFAGHQGDFPRPWHLDDVDHVFRRAGPPERVHGAAQQPFGDEAVEPAHHYAEAQSRGR